MYLGPVLGFYACLRHQLLYRVSLLFWNDDLNAKVGKISFYWDRFVSNSRLDFEFIVSDNGLHRLYKIVVRKHYWNTPLVSSDKTYDELLLFCTKKCESIFFRMKKLQSSLFHTKKCQSIIFFKRLQIVIFWYTQFYLILLHKFF